MRAPMWIKEGGEGTVAPLCSFGQMSWAAESSPGAAQRFAPIVAGLEEATLRPTQAPIPLVPVLDPYGDPTAWTWTQPLFHPFCALHARRTVADAKAVSHHPLPAKKTAAGTRLRLLVGGAKRTFQSPLSYVGFSVSAAEASPGVLAVTTRVTVPFDIVIKAPATMARAESEAFATTLEPPATMVEPTERLIYGMLSVAGVGTATLTLEATLDLFYSGAHPDGAGGLALDAGSETRTFTMVAA